MRVRVGPRSASAAPLPHSPALTSMQVPGLGFKSLGAALDSFGYAKQVGGGLLGMVVVG